MVGAQIIAIGGLPGTGKSTVAGLLAAELRIPVLSSDLIGNTIKAALDHSAVPVSVAFPTAYRVLFALVEEFVDHGCSVIVDVNLGWQQQWDALDAIARDHPEVDLLPFILRCSEQTCIERLQQRHRDDPARHPPAAEFLAMPQLANVREVLARIDRPDVRRIDAEPAPSDVAAAISAVIPR